MRLETIFSFSFGPVLYSIIDLVSKYFAIICSLVFVAFCLYFCLYTVYMCNNEEIEITKTAHDVKPAQEPENRGIMDLRYIVLPPGIRPVNSNSQILFFFDFLDPVGVKFSHLVQERGLTAHTFQGYHGYVTGASKINVNGELIARLSCLSRYAEQSEQFNTIFSKGVPIQKHPNIGDKHTYYVREN